MSEKELLITILRKLNETQKSIGGYFNKIRKTIRDPNENSTNRYKDQIVTLELEIQSVE